MKWRGKIRNRSGAPAKGAVDHTARRIGYASVLISALAVLVPFAQQEFLRQEGKAERVAIAAARSLDLPLVDSGSNFARSGRLINEPWRITLSNNGSRTISVVDLQIEKHEGNSQVFYTGLNAGLFNQDGSALHMPVQLQAGESQIIIGHVGIVAPFNAYAALKDQFDQNSGKVNNLTAIQLLARSHIDLYGNPVEYQEFKSGGFLIKANSNTKLPVFAVRLKTGAGSEFLQSMSSDHP